MGVLRRLVLIFLLFSFCIQPVRADTVKWVDFQVPYESLKFALDRDVATFEQEKHIDWIDLLAVAACRTGGKCSLESVKKAAKDLSADRSQEEKIIDKDFYREYNFRGNTAMALYRSGTALFL
jgi:hypothetical protein